MKRFLSSLFKIFVSAVLLIFLFSRIDFRNTISYIARINYPYFIVAAIIFIAIAILGFFRWKMLLGATNRKIPTKRIGMSFMGGLFFNLFLPSSIGGDSAKVVDLSLYTKDSSFVLATTILDRLCGFTGLFLIAFFSFFYGFFVGIISDFALLFVIVLLGIGVILLWSIFLGRRFFKFFINFVKFKRLQNYFIRFHDACCKLRFQKNILLKAIFISLFIQGGLSVVCYFIGLSLGINLSLFYYFVFIPLVTVISMVPISIGGLGMRDNAAVLLFSSLQVAEEKIVAMTLLLFSLFVFIGIIGGCIYGFALYSRRLQYNK